eukprot:6612551-Pyramimonas_sp.AAC.1
MSPLMVHALENGSAQAKSRIHDAVAHPTRDPIGENLRPGDECFGAPLALARKDGGGTTESPHITEGVPGVSGRHAVTTPRCRIQRGV